MPQLMIVNANNVLQSADHLTWPLGVNTIVFAEPFADANYTFDPNAPSDVVITEVPGSRTPAGLQINLDVGTTEGRYTAVGLSSEFTRTSALDLGRGVIISGSQPLLAGRNTISWSVPFSDTTYNFQPIGNAVNITIDMASKTTTSIDVIAADDDPDFQFEIIGV